MREFNSIDELRPLVGHEVAVSDWVTIDADRVERFACATRAHSVDEDISSSGEPATFVAAIARDFLALSLLPWLSQQTLSIRDTKMAVNLGLNRVRFPAPIIAGSRLRGRFTLRQIDTLEPLGGMPGVQVVWEVTIEQADQTEPICVAESVSRRYG
ncbi:MAG: MaoC family dehydratase [Steroidobacteraceae bacterium]|jgi:acyl dehydratase